MKFKDNKFVKVKGLVKYGDEHYEVDTFGIVSAIVSQKTLCVTLDEIDGDGKAACLVPKKICTPMKYCEVGSYLTGEDFNDTPEFLNYLSDKFVSKLEKFDDAQEAFDDLDEEYDYYLSKLGCVYSLTNGASWHVEVDEDLFNIIKVRYFNELLGENFEEAVDLASYIENKVCDTMSNCGCDYNNALAMELNELAEDFNDLYENNFTRYNLNGFKTLFKNNIKITSSEDYAPKIEILDPSSFPSI